MRLGMGLGLGNLLSGGPITGMSNKYSFNFDASNDYLDCGNPTDLQITGAMSISAWVKTSTTDFKMIVSKDDGSSNRNWHLKTESNGYVRFQLWSGGSMSNSTGDINIADGDWHHIAVTYNPSTAIKIYVDGTLDENDTSSIASSIDNDTVNLNIGRIASGNYFNGDIDEVAIWNAVLSDSDITKIASKPVDFSKASAYDTDRTSNLKLWLRAGDKVLPEEDASIARSDFYSDFDGANDYVSVADNDDLSFGSGSSDTPFSISAWINPVDATNFTIVSKGVFNTDAEYILQLDGDDKLYFALYDESVSNTYEGAYFNTALTSYQGSWFHVVATYNGVGGTSANAGIKLYIDGVEKSTSLIGGGTYVAMENLGGELEIGRISSTYADGKISNLALYKTQLDAQTIKQFAKSRFTPMRDNRFSVVDFDGTNDKITMTASSAVSPTEAITVSAWVNFDALQNYDVVVGNTDSGFNGWRIAMDNSNNIAFSINGWTSNFAGTPMSTTGVWHHIVGTYDKNNVKIYLNGELKATDSYTGSISYSSNVFQIGYADTWSYLDGSVSSVSVYSTAKSADEIYAIYQQGITYDESSLSGLVGYWRMGDDTSKAYPTIADSSSNSNDGTITNGASDDIVQQMVAGWDMGAFESSSEELSGERFGTADNDWTVSGSYVSISDGVLSYTGSGVDNDNMTYAGSTFGAFTFATGKLYKLVVTIANTTTARFKVQTSSDSTVMVASANYSSGTHTIYLLATSSHNGQGITIRGEYSQSNFDITEYSLKEVLQSEVSDTYPAIIDVNEPVLGVELWDSDASTFDSGTHSWVVYGNNTIANDSGALKITYVDNTNGAYIWLKDASDLNSDLVVGKLYKLTFDAKVNTGSVDLLVIENGGSTPSATITETSFTSKTIIFEAHSTTTEYIRLNIGSGEILFLDNFSLQQIQGNVGTMTNQAADDLVYSSVLPDQSFLTGVNSAYNYIDLDGSDEYIAHSNISFTGAFSISSWINLDNVSSGRPIVGDTGNNNWFKVVDADTAGIRIAGGTATEWDAGMTFSTGSWAYVAVVRNASNEIIVYVNGVAYTSNQPTLSGTYVLNALGQKGNGQYFDGKIGQIALYNKALLEREVGAIYSLGRHGNLLDKYSDNLVGYWAMGALDASTGLSDVGNGTIYDRSGNSNHGTGTNTESADLASSPNADPNGYAKGDTNRSTTIP